jgi:hypothetical protein
LETIAYDEIQMTNDGGMAKRLFVIRHLVFVI